MYDEPIILLEVAKENVDENGDIVKEYDKKEVFVEIKSITMSESYKALASDIEAKCVFVLADYLDYENQEEFIYNGEQFSLVRTYRVPGTDQLEIVVKK